MPRPRKTPQPPQAEPYKHPTADSPMRPEVGTQAQFRKKKPPKTYRYDSSLSPALDWDGQNPTREQGEALIRQIIEAKSLIEAKAAAEQLKRLGQPFLNWAGKAERLSFDVPTLPLFVHERLSTKGIIETLKATSGRAASSTSSATPSTPWRTRCCAPTSIGISGSTGWSWATRWWS